ncbi:MAG: beta-galactosidase [Anaerolineae bacterium]
MSNQLSLQRLRTVFVVFVVLFLVGCVPAKTTAPTTMLIQTPTVTSVILPSPHLPDFIPTVRAYGGGGYDDFQRRSMRELGLEYVQGLADFAWQNVELRDDGWKWAATDEQMDKLAQAGLKVIAFIICPKSPGLPWDETITRDAPRFAAEYGEFAYEVVNRYHAHPAWSGLVAAWGGSADVWDHNYPATNPEVVVPLLNAAYDGIKRADPATIVIGFNFATTAHSIE